MEICYKRNLNQSYMFITSDPAYSGYQISMCRQNHIHNLLQFEPVVSEGETQFRYEITGKRSLDYVLESSDFAIDMFAKMLETLLGICQEIRPYLLEEEGILLDPESIYLENGTKKFYFTYCPGRQEPVTEGFRKLMEYLLAKINHEDEQMVLASYEAYQKSTEEGFSLGEILRILYQYRQQDVEDYVPVRQKSVSSKKVEALQKGIMPWEQEKKDAAVEEKPITKKKKGYWKKYEIDTIEKDDEYYKKDAQSRGWNMAMEEKLQECIAAISRIPAFLTGKINHEKEEEPIVCTPMDYKEMQEENPTVYLGTERAPEGVLRYDGKEDISNIRMEYFPFIIGSSEQADGNVCIQGVSRMHARITREKEDYYVEDLNSMNGTWLNGKMLAYREKEQLCMNDVIQLGRERFTFL